LPLSGWSFAHAPHSANARPHESHFRFAGEKKSPGISAVLATVLLIWVLENVIAGNYATLNSIGLCRFYFVLQKVIPVKTSWIEFFRSDLKKNRSTAPGF
jgi:hypothetical protein